MHRSLRVVTAIATLAATACARKAVEPAVPSGAPVVALERRPCYGTCPVYTVALYADGTVVFDGRRFVLSMGRHATRVAARDVSRLVAQFNGFGFAALPDKIISGSSACGDYASDAPILVITLRQRDAEKTVEHDRGCSAAPAFLSVLEQAVDSVAGTARWIAP